MALERANRELIDKYIAETEALIDEIENSPTTVEVTGTKYYVAADGNDENDGLTPETAWKTIEKVNEYKYKYGDGVFFKRGDSWRQTYALRTTKGVTYSAYGEGPKPRIVASVDGAGADKWEKTEYDNIYRFVEKIPGKERDVGVIVFDGGKAWGIQIQKTKEGNRHEIGRVFNGIEWFDTTVGPFEDQRDLDNNLEFYHNWEEETLYLYCKAGNPGEVFKTIEIVDRGHGIELRGNMDVVIDNLEIYGAGSHGIGGGDLFNVTVQYCTLKWIGGSIQGKYIFNRNYGVRFGNAVESYGSSDHFTIHHCYASHVYDCCWTVQFGGAAIMRNVAMYKNVAEFCNTGLEVWQNGGLLENMKLHDNYTRYNGYGWSHQRANKDANFFYGADAVARVNRNNEVFNNINYLSQKFVLLARPTGKEHYNFHDNLYIMEEGKFLGGITEHPATSSGELKRDVPYDAENIERTQAEGFEPGSKFYVCDAEILGDMYKLCIPKD